MKNLKLVSDPSKYEIALQKMDEEINLSFMIRIFYNRHLIDFIDLNDEHDFLSEDEAKVLILLARLLQDGIIEDISESEAGLSGTRNFTF